MDSTLPSFIHICVVDQVEPFIQPFLSWKTGHANMSVCLSVDILGLHKSLSFSYSRLLQNREKAVAKISAKHRRGEHPFKLMLSLSLSLSCFLHCFLFHKVPGEIRALKLCGMNSSSAVSQSSSVS